MSVAKLLGSLISRHLSIIVSLGKHKIHCNKWEVGVRVSDGWICWINRPYPGSFHDLSILNKVN